MKKRRKARQAGKPEAEALEAEAPEERQKDFFGEPASVKNENALERVFHAAHAHRKIVVTKRLPKRLEKLRKIERERYHPLQHELHRAHKISRRTLFYVKEYGPHSNVAQTIVRESLKVLLFASLLSALGGFALENIKHLFVAVVPLVILLPALNGMIGDYGTIVSSKFSAMLHEGKITSRDWLRNKGLRKLFAQVVVLAAVSATIGAAAALTIAGQNFESSAELAFKVFAVALIDALLLVSVLFAVAVLAGFYFYSKREDPNNFLIPITTSVADFSNMLLLTILVTAFF